MSLRRQLKIGHYHFVLVLMFDKISLKQNLQYGAKCDVVTGYLDNGQEKMPAVANTAFQILVSGI